MFSENIYFEMKEYTFFEKGCRKSACDNPERYCGGIHCCLKKFERMAREAMGICLRVLK